MSLDDGACTLLTNPKITQALTNLFDKLGPALKKIVGLDAKGED